MTTSNINLLGYTLWLDPWSHIPISVFRMERVERMMEISGEIEFLLCYRDRWRGRSRTSPEFARRR